jgi:ribosomal protein S24E
MELKITNDYDNKLLGRREISASAVYTDKTPTKEEVKEALCKRLSLDPALVEIREIRQQYGLRVSDVTAYTYANKEVMEKLVKKRGVKGGKKPEEKSTATVKEEKK